MFKIKFNQKNAQKRMVIVMTLLCLMTCAVNVQFYLEYQVAVNIVAHKTACLSELNRNKNYFDMPINELMDVAVVS